VRPILKFENIELFEKEILINNFKKYVPIKSFDNINSLIQFELSEVNEFEQLSLPL
jgi:hypothetical protein